MPLISKNPATEEILAMFEEHTEKEVEQKLQKAQQAFLAWRTLSFQARGDYINRAAGELRKNSERYATAITKEMGKPIISARGEIEKCALVCEYYAKHAEQFLAPETVATDASESYIFCEPFGIILAVMPWNFPFWQVLRFAAPALMAGNVGVLKHASNVPQCAQLLEQIFLQAGFPEGIFTTLLIGSSRVEALIKDRRVQAVTLTGSEHAGQSMACTAGNEIKKTVLELGGSDPFIVFADADVAEAASLAVLTRLQGVSGQSCIAAKRFIVHSSVAAEFIALVKKQCEAQVVGDPFDEKTTVGPLSSAQILHDVERQVDASLKAGAVLITGGKKMGEKGNFYAPTVVTNVKKGMPLYEEEVFGPVIAVIEVENEEEALAVANDTPFGLAASLWTKDKEKAKKYIPLIQAGSVFVNGRVHSDPRLPFGGIKRSGYGRELSHYGIKEFVNIKTVWIK